MLTSARLEPIDLIKQCKSEFSVLFSWPRSYVRAASHCWPIMVSCRFDHNFVGRFVRVHSCIFDDSERKKTFALRKTLNSTFRTVKLKVPKMSFAESFNIANKTLISLLRSLQVLLVFKIFIPIL